MDAEQLAAIRARTDAASKRTDNPDDALAVDLLGITYYCEDVAALLAEVERLRAENAALREIAEAVAAVAVDEQRQVERCMYCRYWFTGWPISHAAACPVTMARALLGKE